jgi:hypothetical protein
MLTRVIVLRDNGFRQNAQLEKGQLRQIKTQENSRIKQLRTAQKAHNIN